MKKVPLRTCVITREKLEKKDLVRIVRNNEGEVFVDETGRANGRGAYIKRDLDTLEKAIKTNALERHLECKIPNEIYEQIKNIIEG